MANTNDIANDPQEEKKVQSSIAISPPEGAAEDSDTPSKEDTNDQNKVVLENGGQKNSETPRKLTKDFNQMSLTDLVEELQKRIKAAQWFSDDKNIKEIIHTFETQFKLEIQKKKKAFIKEGGNEIDFYFKPQYKNTFDQSFREYKKTKEPIFKKENNLKNLILIGN